MAGLLTCGAGPSPFRYVEGELLVKFRGGPRGEAAAQAQRAFQHEVKRHFDQVGWQHIQLPPGQTVADALGRYQQHAAVLAVEPNYLHEVVPLSGEGGMLPSDLRFSEQWALARIGATNAWAIATGGDVVVAVIDSGVNYCHEDLTTNMWRNPGESGLDAHNVGKEVNGVDDDGNGYVDDLHGIDVVSHDGFPRDGLWSGGSHGTWCAGIIGAVGNNGRGIAGVNWSVQIMALRFLHSSATVSNYVDSVGFVEACTYVLDQKSRGVNIRVTNNSWGFTADPGQIVRAAIDALGQVGILNVFPAGYDIFGTGQGTNLDIHPVLFPQYWHLPSMLTVAASGQADELLVSKSNWGLTNVDLAAPGVSILTTDDALLCTNYSADPSPNTSPSCALVAGAAALLAAAYPSATARQIQTALLESVDRLDDLTNRVSSGGRLNVAQALQHPCLATNAPAFVTRQPQSQTNGLGCSANFRVTATGAQPLNYSWRLNGASLADDDRISGATASALTLRNVQLSDAGAYAVVLSNAFGMATSTVATLTVATCPLIQTQPRSQRLIDRTNTSLSVTAVGACPLTFQWERDGQAIPGATNAILTLTNLTTTDSADYQVVVGNACGNVISDPATLTVLGWPWIVAQPVSQTVAVGSDVTLRVDLADTTAVPVGFRWRRNSTFLGWVTNGFTNIVSLPNIQTTSAGTWSVAFITNAATLLMAKTAASGTSYVTVVKPPASQMVWAGQTAVFALNAVGPAPLRYQWQFNGVNLPGETRTNLVLSPVQLSHAGQYTAVVTNAAGEPTGFPARLHVLLPCEDPTAPPGPCTNATVRLVRCQDQPASCVEIRWPSSACPVPLDWTEDLSAPDWQPFPSGPVPPDPDCACVLLLVTQESMFFRFRCP